MPLTSDAEIAALLNEARTIALVGASPKPDRPSWRVMGKLLDHGGRGHHVLLFGGVDRDGEVTAANGAQQAPVPA